MLGIGWWKEVSGCHRGLEALVRFTMALERYLKLSKLKEASYSPILSSVACGFS
jgi:hypothetical protein